MVTQARRVLIGTKDQLIPLWVLQNGEGELAIYATPWPNSAVKNAIVKTMKDIMRETKTVAYSFLDEAWTVKLSREEMAAYGAEYKGPAPSEHPNRSETVICHIAEKSGRKVLRQWDIVRDASGKCVELRRDSEDVTEVIGTFDSLLDERKPS